MYTSPVIYNAIERVCALVLFIVFFPILGILYIWVKLDSKGPFLFTQRRAGKEKKPFIIYKIRTMVEGAEGLKSKVKNLNEADGPVFKIRKDPRFTRSGIFLSHCALDELPQLINIMKGEMSFIGPRPLPVAEARRVPKKYDMRFNVLPGMTSTWIANGAHALSFKQWMELDVDYAKHHSLKINLWIVWKTVLTIIKQILYTST